MFILCNSLTESKFIREIFFLLIIPSLFLLKIATERLINTVKQNEISKQKNSNNHFYLIIMIILGLVKNYRLCYLKEIIDPGQIISITNAYLSPHKSSPWPKFFINEIIYCIVYGCVNESVDQGRSYLRVNILVSDCFFSRTAELSGNGGVIYVSSGTYLMNVNYSMFYKCTCSGNGGAISFYSSNSSLRMICANSCNAYNYHFGIFQTQIFQVDFLSVSNCSHTTTGYGPIRSNLGTQRVDNTNFSMNNAKQYSVFGVSSPSSFTSSHCTLSNNKVLQSICINFLSDSGIILVSFTNIIHNNSPSLGVVYISGSGATKMMYCIFQNNDNYLFCVGSGSLEVSDSFIDHSSSSFSSLLAVSTASNNSNATTKTYRIQFFNSYLCNADIPLFDRIPIQTPEKSLEETISRTNQDTLRLTYEKTFNITNKETLPNTLNESPMCTLKETPIHTNDLTMRETQKETPYRTFSNMICTNQKSNMREISVIFSFYFMYLS